MLISLIFNLSNQMISESVCNPFEMFSEQLESNQNFVPRFYQSVI